MQLDRLTFTEIFPSTHNSYFTADKPLAGTQTKMVPMTFVEVFLLTSRSYSFHSRILPFSFTLDSM